MIFERATAPASARYIKRQHRCSANRMNGSIVCPIMDKFEMSTSESRPLRRGQSAENLEYFASSSGRHKKSAAKIGSDQQNRGSRSTQLVSRQRPATFHNVMTSNLQKNMRENAQKWCQRVVREKGIAGLKSEFASLKKPFDPSTAKVFMEQPPGTRNRYRDVPCLDKTRVVLKNVENDYIHASYVSTPQNEKRFICTQGPNDLTCGDFWRMVLQEKTVCIIMLCNIFEKQAKKCAEYFPSKVGESMTFDNIVITCRVQKNMELPKDSCTQKIVIRITGLVIVTNGDQANPHYCDHYQWMDWPDRGVVPSDLTTVHLLNAVRPCKYPIIVHCSAGIGRTGSIVMIEYIIELFLSGKPFEKSDEILSKIREQRSFSIQTDQQYLFVHRVILEYLYRLKLLDPDQLPHIKKFLDDYNRATQC